MSSQRFSRSYMSVVRGRGRNRGNSRRFQTMITARIDQSTRGYRFSPPLTPAEFVSQPWNSATIRLKFSKEKSKKFINMSDLARALTTQLGLVSGTTPIDVEIRIQKVAAWGIDSTYLRILPIDLSSDDGSELIALDATAQKNLYPVLGYVYPVSNQVKSIKGSKSKYLLYVEFDGTIEIHFGVLWRAMNIGTITVLYENLIKGKRLKELDKSEEVILRRQRLRAELKEIEDQFEDLCLDRLEFEDVRPTVSKVMTRSMSQSLERLSNCSIVSSRLEEFNK